MSYSRISADPDLLEHYAVHGLEQDQELIARGRRLGQTLCAFQQTCTEPGFCITAGSLSNALKKYGEDNTLIDEHVRRVGQGFVLADGMQLGVQAGTTWWGNFKQWLASVNVQDFAKSALRFVPIIGAPAWLAWKVGELSWLKEREESVSPATGTALGQLVQEQNENPSSTSPSPEVSRPPQPAPEDAENIKTGVNGGESSRPPGHASPPEQSAPDVMRGIHRVKTKPKNPRTGDCVKFVADHRGVPHPVLTWQNGGVDDNWNYGSEPKIGAIMVEGYDSEIKIGRKINGTKWGHVSYVDWVEYNDAGKPIRFHVVEGGWEGGKHEQTFDWPIGNSSKRKPHRFIYDKKK